MRKTLAAVSPWQKAYERDGATCYSAALLRGLNGAAVLEDGRVTWQSLHALLQRKLADYQPGEYGFDRSEGVILASYPDRALVRTPGHQPFAMPHPPLPKTDFVGREEELQRLADMLTGEDAVDVALLPAITGIGSIGKARLAIEFVHEYRNRFPDGIFWLNMEHPEAIEAQIAACGGTRGLQLFDDSQSELSSRQSAGFDGGMRNTERLSLHQQAELVRTIWEQPGCRLIIFDNLEDPALLHKWRPRGGGSRLLITTRRQTWAATSGVRPFSLTILSDEASRALLLRPRAEDRGCTIDHLLADPDEAKAAQDIIRELGGLPLALTLAGGYLAKSSLPLTRYLELLRSESIRHQSLNQELSEGLPQAERASIVAAFALSYQRLSDNPIDSLARTIWLAAAQLAPEPIPEEVLIRTAAIDPADESRREQFAQALQHLRELGLIERSAEGEGYRLHRLLGAYARSVSTDCAADWRRAAQGLAQTIQRLDDEGELSAPTFRDHVRQLLDAQMAVRDADSAALFHAAGLVMYADDNYPTARRYLEEALAIADEVLGRRHRETAVTLHELGRLAANEGDYPTARRYLEEALAITDEVLGRRHRETAVTLHELGNVAQAAGDYPTARRYLEEALAITDEVLGRRHRETAITIYSRRWLVWKAIWETAACAVLTWFVLPDHIALIGAGLVLVLGVIGYFWWRQATGVVRVLWRTQVGWLVTLLFLSLPARSGGALLPIVVHALAAGGAMIGLFWSRIMALSALRNARLRIRRWLYRGLQRL